MFKRILALALAGCLTLESAPMTVMAAEPQTVAVSDNSTEEAAAASQEDAADEAETDGEDPILEEGTETLEEEGFTQEASTEGAEGSPVEDGAKPETEEQSTEDAVKPGTEEVPAEDEAEPETEEQSTEDAMKPGTEEVPAEDGAEPGTEELFTEDETEEAATEQKTDSSAGVKALSVTNSKEDPASLTVGEINTLTLPAKNEDNSVNEVWYSFTAQEAGRYLFYANKTDVGVASYLYLHKNTESEELMSGQVTSYSDLNLLSKSMQAGEVIYLRAYTQADQEVAVSLEVKKVPEYSLVSQSGGGYLADADDYTLAVDLKIGYQYLRGSALLSAKDEQAAGSYGLRVYWQKVEGTDEKNQYFSISEGQSSSFLCSLDGAGQYRVYLIVEEDSTKKPLAIFDGNILLMAGSTSAPYVINDTVITENTITFDLEKFSDGTCYYAPVDGSEEERSIAAGKGWYDLMVSGLKPGTEYSFEFTDENNKVVGIEKVTTQASSTEIALNAAISEEDSKLVLTANVSHYLGDAALARFCYEYTDALGRVQTKKKEYNLSEIAIVENEDKAFTISVSEAALFLADSVYEITLWLEFDGIEYSRTTKEVSTKAASVTDQKVRFTVETGESGTTASAAVSVQGNTDNLTGYLFYQPQNDLSTSYDEASVLVSGSTTATVECTNIQPGVSYRFILFIGGIKKEVNATIGTAAVKLSPVGDARINAFDFVRTFTAENSTTDPLTETYYLRMYYLLEGGSTYEAFGEPLALNAENAYQADFSTAAKDEKLMPDQEYRLKWTLSTSTEESALPISTYYEIIKTEKADLTIESAGNYYDQKDYIITLNEASVSNFSSAASFPVYGYVRKEDGLAWRQAGSLQLKKSLGYKGTLSLSGLEAKTSYELSLRSSDGKEYTEYASLRFTTPADTRTLSIVSVDAEPRSAKIRFSMDLPRSAYVLCYVRPKGTGDPWEKAAYASYTQGSLSGTLTITTYGGKQLKDETEYEYQIGFGENWNTALTDLEQTIIQTFKTAKDERTVTAGISEGYTMADIAVQFSGNPYQMDSYLSFFYRQKGSSVWSRANTNSYHTSQTVASHSVRLTGLGTKTTYEYAVVVTDSSSLSNPDEVTEKGRKVTGTFTTKSNAYTLGFKVNESTTTGEKAVLEVSAKGSNEDAILYVTLSLNDGQEQTVSLKRGNGYLREVAFTDLLPKTEYMITEAVFKVSENGRLVEIDRKNIGYKFTTKEVKKPTKITLSEGDISLNTIYGNEKLEGFNVKTLTATVEPQGASEALKWTSSDTNVVEVSETGVITPKSIGEAEITVSSVHDKSVSASCKVRVKRYAVGYVDTSGAVKIFEAIETLSLSKGKSLDNLNYYEVSTGGAKTLLTDYTVTPVREGIVTWKDKKLEAVATGETRVIFEKDGVKAAIQVEVKAAGRGFGIVSIDHQGSDYPAVKTGTDSYTLAYGKTAVLTYKAVGEISPRQEFKAEDFNWSVSDPAVAKVDQQGNIEPLAAGKVTLTVTPRADSEKSSYLQEKAEVELTIKALPEVETNLVLYAQANVDKTIQDVEFPKSWGEGWSWKYPKTPLVTNGVYTENSYDFQAVYSGTAYYPGEVTVQVYIGRITGVFAQERGDDHKQVLQVGGTDSITLTLGVNSQGKLLAANYSLDLPEVRNLNIEKAADGSYRITTQKPGKYTLKPVAKIGEKTVATGRYVITAVKDPQVASITLSTATAGVTIEENRIILDAAKVKKEEKGFVFDLKATVKDRYGAEAATKLTWKSTDSSVVSVKNGEKNDTHNVKVTAKNEGHAVLMATAKDKTAYKTVLNVEVRDYSPRISTQKATVNIAFNYDSEEGRRLASGAGLIEIIPAYGEKISGVQLMDKEGKKPEINLELISYEANTWLVSPTAEKIELKTYECTLRVKTTEGSTYDYPIKVSAVSKRPTVTMEMETAINLFYTNRTADIPLKISNDARVDSVVWIDTSKGANNGFSMEARTTLTESGKYTSSIRVSQEEKLTILNGALQDSGVAKGNLTITLYGYRGADTFKDFEILYEYQKPSLITKAASTTISPDIGQNGNTFYLYDDTNKCDITYSEKSGTYSCNEVVCEDENVKLTTYPGEAQIDYIYTGKSTTAQIKMVVDSVAWREPISVVHDVQAKTAKAYLSSSTLTYNALAKNSLSTEILINNGLVADYVDVRVKGANKKAQELLDKDILVITATDNVINISQNDARIMGEKISKGSYKYQIIPYYISTQTGAKKTLNTMTLTIKVVDKAVTAKISPKGAIDLANGSQFDVKAKKNCAWTDPVFSNLSSGYYIADYQLAGEYSDYFILEEGYVGSGTKAVKHYYITVDPDDLGKLKAGQTYKLAVTYTMENGEGERLTVTSNTFNLKPKQSKPKVTIANNNQTLYAAADKITRTYGLLVPEYYMIESASGSLDCNKDGIADITAEIVEGTEGLTVRLSDCDAVAATVKGKSYTVPVTVKVVGRDGVSQDTTVKIKVTVRR